MSNMLSIWDDYAVDTLWLHSDYPTTAPRVARGTSATSSGKPASVEAAGGSVHVIYSDIRSGEIRSTYTGAPYAAPGTTPSSTTTSKAPRPWELPSQIMDNAAELGTDVYSLNTCILTVID
ncbi:hypothetical protein FRB96_006478 [Tulasnella sp. 330]|nr:hypothetical protein FRB96_006478 [Tulasnella sp. 330]